MELSWGLAFMEFAPNQAPNNNKIKLVLRVAPASAITNRFLQKLLWDRRFACLWLDLIDFCKNSGGIGHTSSLWLDLLQKSNRFLHKIQSLAGRMPTPQEFLHLIDFSIKYSLWQAGCLPHKSFCRGLIDFSIKYSLWQAGCLPHKSFCRNLITNDT
ncbi:hypothetical protein MiSe_35760 [Microseira wollei NIES-4236]|uniref:Transposase n=1 Tax=Microseira wollei NIES-4236 TaxID=2530354 RepID=A0AAV3XH56_9CYAN|nr:hypothetical protein MiSe_35760 [Microseira wollei NIES-4236]